MIVLGKRDSCEPTPYRGLVLHIASIILLIGVIFVMTDIRAVHLPSKTYFSPGKKKAVSVKQVAIPGFKISNNCIQLTSFRSEYCLSVGLVTIK